MVLNSLFIKLSEKCPCNNKDVLRKTDGEWIRQLKPYLNMSIAGRTSKEYYNDNKEHVLKQKKQYMDTNKEHFNAIAKEKQHVNVDAPQQEVL